MHIEIACQFVSWRASPGAGHFYALAYLLEKDAPPFGAAIAKLEILPYFAYLQIPYPSFPPGTSQNEIDMLCPVPEQAPPKCTFIRKKQLLQIEYQSEVCTADEIFPHCDPSEPRLFELYNADRARRFYCELLEVMAPLFSKAVRKSDDFNVKGFMAWANAKLDELPVDDNSFKALVERAAKEQDLRRNQQDPWESLQIDWREYHRKAREILDDPVFWDCLNDFTPHGNDTGADLLTMYKEWRGEHPKESSEVFFADLLSLWQFPPALDDTDYAAACIALPFAELKVDGTCTAISSKRAIEAAKKQAEVILEWSSPSEEGLQILNKIKEKLLALHKTK